MMLNVLKIGQVALIALIAAAISARGDSVTIINRCSRNVWVQDQAPNSAKNILAPAGRTIGAAQGIDQTAKNGGLAFNFLLGCDANGNGCTDQNKAMSRAEMSFPRTAAGATFINLSNIYGFSVPTSIVAAGCPTYSCNIQSGCPVGGPLGGECASPCCSSLNGCQGVANCPTGSRGDPNGGAGPHAAFYQRVCKNSYAYPDEDSDFPARNLGSYCSGSDITITLCGGPSSNLLL